MKTEKIKETVESVVRERFKDAHIVAIDITEDTDHDGDPILRVDVIYDGDDDLLDARGMSGLVRHLRPKLADFGEERFPLMSYISRADAERDNPEAA